MYSLQYGSIKSETNPKRFYWQTQVNPKMRANIFRVHRRPQDHDLRPSWVVAQRRNFRRGPKRPVSMRYRFDKTRYHACLRGLKGPLLGSLDVIIPKCRRWYDFTQGNGRQTQSMNKAYETCRLCYKFILNLFNLHVQQWVFYCISLQYWLGTLIVLRETFEI